MDELEIINKIRNSNIVCCFSIHSDYYYCWWAEWSYAELNNKNDSHKIHRTNNYDELIDCLKEASNTIFNLTG